MNDPNPYERPKSGLSDRPDAPPNSPARRGISWRPMLVGMLLGLIAGAVVSPPVPLAPITGDLVWLLGFVAIGGLAGAVGRAVMHGI